MTLTWPEAIYFKQNNNRYSYKVLFSNPTYGHCAVQITSDKKRINSNIHGIWTNRTLSIVVYHEKYHLVLVANINCYNTHTHTHVHQSVLPCPFKYILQNTICKLPQNTNTLTSSMLLSLSSPLPPTSSLAWFSHALHTLSIHINYDMLLSTLNEPYTDMPPFIRKH